MTYDVVLEENLSDEEVRLTTESILVKAITVLTEYGWIQGSNGNACMGYCLTGALRFAENEVCGVPAPAPYAHFRVRNYVRHNVQRSIIMKQLPTHSGRFYFHGDRVRVIDWNDAWDRTLEEVINVLHTALEQVRRKIAIFDELDLGLYETFNT